MLGSRFSDFAFRGCQIAFHCVFETFVSGFGEFRHPSVTSGDVGGMWMSPTLPEVFALTDRGFTSVEIVAMDNST